MISKIKYNYLDPLLNNNLEITFGDKTWNLHNDADFIELRYNVLERKGMLIWNYPSKWFRENGIFHADNEYLEEHDIGSTDKKIALIFELVHLFEVKLKDTGLPIIEDTCLSDIRKFYEDTNGNIYEDGSITFFFQGGSQIRINADVITLETDIS